MAVRMERRNERLVAAFATTLAEQRARSGLSQEELAARADVSARFVSLLETARRQPSLTAMLALSHGLDIRMADLAAEVERHYANAADDDQVAVDV